MVKSYSALEIIEAALFRLSFPPLPGEEGVQERLERKYPDLETFIDRLKEEDNNPVVGKLVTRLEREEVLARQN